MGGAKTSPHQSSSFEAEGEGTIEIDQVDHCECEPMRFNLVYISLWGTAKRSVRSKNEFRIRFAGFAAWSVQSAIPRPGCGRGRSAGRRPSRLPPGGDSAVYASRRLPT